MAPKVVKWFPAEGYQEFLESLREGTFAVIAVREDGSYAVHYDYDEYTAECHAADWHMKFLDDAKVYINRDRRY